MLGDAMWCCATPDGADWTMPGSAVGAMGGTGWCTVVRVCVMIRGGAG